MRLGLAVVLALASLQALVLVGATPAEATHGGTQEWLRQLGITSSDAVGSGVAVDSSGNVYVTGGTTGTLPGSPDTNTGGTDVLVASWDSSGTSRWVHQLGTTDDDAQGTRVAVDSNGNIYVTGYTDGTLPGSPDTNTGGTDVFVASWDSSGTSRWVHQLGTTDDDAVGYGYGVAVDSNGNVYVTGGTTGTLPGSPDTNTGGTDVFVASWDTNGTSRWVHQLGTTDDDALGYGYGVAVDSNGNVYVTGGTTGTLPGSPDTHAGGQDAFVASWATDGTPGWIRQLGTTDDEFGAGVAVDTDGNIYVTGFTEGMLPGSPDTHAGGQDAFVASWATDGTPGWIRQLGTTDTEIGAGVAVDTDGTVYVTGYTFGTLPGSPDTNAGEQEVFIATWATDGTPGWVHQLGTTGGANGNGVAVDTGGNLYISGSTAGTLPGSPDTNAGGSDVFVAQWAPAQAENTAPVAQDQTLTTTTDTAVAVTLTATDDGLPDPPNTLTYTVVDPPAHGTLTGLAPNLTYTPNAGYSGEDTLTFKANDNELDSNTATITITIEDAPPTNQAPVAQDQTLTTATDTPLAVTLAATDDGLPNPPNTLTYTVVDPPTHGTLTGTEPDLTYTPNAGYSGEDTFTFKANDNELDSNTATITITVEAAPPTNQAPVAQDQTLTTATDTPLAVTLTATDDGLPDPPNTLTYTVVDPPTNGTLTGEAPNLTYTPNAGYTGTDTLTFKANDTELDSDTATITITIEAEPPTNQAPTAQDQTLTTTADTALAVTLTATDDGLPNPPNTLTYTVVTEPANGTLTGEAPDLTYTPDAGYTGTDTLTFKANDTELDSDTATVTITIEDDGGDLADTELFAMNALSWRTRDGQVVIPHAWVRLTDADTGAGIAGQEIVLTVDGQPLCTATTRAHGWARCGGTITGDATTIAAGYDATYAGNTTHAPSDDHGNLFELRRRHHPRTNWWWWRCTNHNHNHGHTNNHHGRHWRWNR